MTLSKTSSKIIFIAFIAISLMAALSITTSIGSASSFTECSDGYDNNFNGLVDQADPACHTDWNASNPSSYDPTINAEHGSAPVGGGGSGTWGDGCPGSCPIPPQCDDNQDNDQDGYVDYPEDPSCSSRNDNNEWPKDNEPPYVAQCNDGEDNDQDGYVDYPEDPSCNGYSDNNEWPKDNTPPSNTLTCSNPSFNVDEDDLLSFDLHNYISGTNSSYATFSLSNLPSGASFSNNSGEFHWNTDSNDAGTYTLNYSAFLNQVSCNGSIYIDVDNQNNNNYDDLRVICEVDDRSVEVGESVRFHVEIDGGNSPYDIDWRGDIDGDDETERVRFYREGTYEVSVRVEDDDGERDTDQCPDVRVGGGNNYNGDNFPYFTTIAPASARQGASYIYDSNAIDPDGSTVTYSMIYGPTGMTINPYNGLVQWIPTSAQANRSHSVQIRATDTSGDYAYQNFNVYVQGPTIINPPIINPPTPVANLEIFDLRVDNDEFNNVIVSYRTNIPASSRVYYSLTSHFEENTTANYEYQAGGPSNTTFHQVNLGNNLQVDTTYYLRAYAWTSNDTDLTSELAFVLLPNGSIAGINNFTTTRNYRYVDEYALVRIINTDGVVIGDRTDASLATALAVIGGLFLNPWFLLLIIIILLIILLFRRGRDTYISSGGSGPVEIRS